MSEINRNTSNIKLIRQMSYHIIPFSYSSKYDELIKNLTDSSKEPGMFWTPKNDNHHNHFFSHINNLISSREKNETIGTKFILNDKVEESRENYHLPKENTIVCIMDKDSNRPILKFKILEVALYLFETQVGFLLFSYEFIRGNNEELEAMDIVKGNYILKKFGPQFKNTLILENTRDKSQSYLKNGIFSRFHSIKKLLKPTNVNSYFFHNNHPNYALVYNAMIIDQCQDEKSLEGLLFLTRRSFKETYKASKSDIEVETNEEVTQLFKNSYWSASLEGCSNIVQFMDDQTTNEFFNSNYYGDLKNKYLNMYILSLHRRYALLRYSMDASLLPKHLSYYISPSTEERNRNLIHLNELKEKLIFFKLRSLYCEVSFFTHDNKIAELFDQVLKVDKLLVQMENEINNLTDIAQMVNDELVTLKDKQDERKSKIFSYYIGGFTFIFTIISAVSSSENIVQIFLKMFNEDYEHHLLLSNINLIVVFVSVILLLMYIDSIKRKD